ncbi:MAG: hypothetical protein KGK18_14345, partial [Burkholderiales bacterium]|nr:hypothetical protein [Burkholderiales bacterium]
MRAAVLAAPAAWIASGDARRLALKRFHTIEIVTGADAVERIDPAAWGNAGHSAESFRQPRRLRQPLRCPPPLASQSTTRLGARHPHPAATGYPSRRAACVQRGRPVPFPDRT